MKSRETFYISIAEIQRDLDVLMRFYNLERSHQGYRLNGRRSSQALREALGVKTLPSVTVDELSTITAVTQSEEIEIAPESASTATMRRRPGVGE